MMRAHDGLLGYFQKVFSYSVQALTWPLLRRVSKRAAYGGFTIHYVADGDSEPVYVELLRKSIELIRRTDPALHRRLLSRYRDIAVVTGGMAQYYFGSGVAMIGAEVLDHDNRAHSAALLISFGVWARALKRFGLRMDLRGYRKIGRRSYRARLHFARELARAGNPNAAGLEAWVRDAMAKLEGGD